jgi:anti-sigma B factor antagonist
VILLMTKRQIQPGLTVLELKGSVHAGTDCRRVEQEVDSLIRAHELRVILDLSQVTHIDSAAIGSVVRCLSQLKKFGGSLRLAGVKGMIEGTLKMTKVDKLIQIYTTAAEAAQDFPAPSGGSDITAT